MKAKKAAKKRKKYLRLSAQIYKTLLDRTDDELSRIQTFFERIGEDTLAQIVSYYRDLTPDQRHLLAADYARYL